MTKQRGRIKKWYQDWINDYLLAPDTFDRDLRENVVVSELEEFIDLICSEVVGETIRKIDKLVQHPPNVGGGDIVCIDLDDWDKLITHLKSK